MLDKNKIKEIENKARANEAIVNTEHRIVKRMIARLEAIKECVPEPDDEKARQLLLENFYHDAKYQPTWDAPLIALQQEPLLNLFKEKLAVGQKRGRAARKANEAAAATPDANPPAPVTVTTTVIPEIPIADITTHSAPTPEQPAGMNQVPTPNP